MRRDSTLYAATQNRWIEAEIHRRILELPLHIQRLFVGFDRHGTNPTRLTNKALELRPSKFWDTLLNDRTTEATERNQALFLEDNHRRCETILGACPIRKCVENPLIEYLQMLARLPTKILSVRRKSPCDHLQMYPIFCDQCRPGALVRCSTGHSRASIFRSTRRMLCLSPNDSRCRALKK